MSTVVSIKERIERLDLAIGQAIAGIGKGYRWDSRGIVDPSTGKNVDTNGARLSMQNLDFMIVSDDETAEEGGQGSDGGVTDKTLPVEIHLKLVVDEQDTQLVGTLQNFWLYQLEVAYMANPLMIEPGPSGSRLAISTRVTHTSQPPIAQGQREVNVILRIEHTYQHNRNDPSIGPGIAPQGIRISSVVDNHGPGFTVNFTGPVNAADWTIAMITGNNGSFTTPTTSITQAGSNGLNVGILTFDDPCRGEQWIINSIPAGVTLSGPMSGFIS